MSREILKRFGKRLRQVREEQKMTQLQLAEKVGIENSYLSTVENGHKEPCLEVIAMLAAGMGVSLRKLFWDL